MIRFFFFQLFKSVTVQQHKPQTSRTNLKKKRMGPQHHRPCLVFHLHPCGLPHSDDWSSFLICAPHKTAGKRSPRFSKAKILVAIACAAIHSYNCQQGEVQKTLKRDTGFCEGGGGGGCYGPKPSTKPGLQSHCDSHVTQNVPPQLHIHINPNLYRSV